MSSVCGWQPEISDAEFLSANVVFNRLLYCSSFTRHTLPDVRCGPVGYHFNDLARFTRLVRLDFGAEIQWLDPSTARQNGSTGWAALDAAIPAWITGWLDPEMLGSREKIGREGPCHAAIGKISYADAPQQVSWLLLIKTSLTGDESVDVLQYSTQNLLFPNSPTTNQFFGDSEWESYRALGYHIGTKLFT